MRGGGVLSMGPGRGSFLPNLCDVRVLFLVVLGGQLLAFTLVLAAGRGRDFFSELAVVSLFVQWVGLSSAAALCLLRTWLARMPDGVAGTLAWGLVLAVTAAFSELVYQLPAAAAMGLTRAPTEHWRLLCGNLAIGAIVSAVALRHAYVQYHWRQQVEQQAQARIQALQSRIRPHFLFNSMNTIASLTRSDPALAERAVEDLAELFRVTLGDASVPTTLGREIETCRRYLDIEGLRLGDRLRVEWALEGLPEDALIPALSLQPLVENAVYHGVQPSARGGVVRITGHPRDARLELSIENSRARASAGTHQEGNRMAQVNVRERIHAFFEGHGDLRVESGPEHYRVGLDLPYRTGRP